MTTELRVMIGLPGSGKSTYIKKETARLMEEQRNVAVISRDAIRFNMLNENDEYFAHERKVFNEFVHQINECLALGIDIVYVDATHLSVASRNKLIASLKPDPATHLVWEYMDTPLEECLRRNEQREGRALVPEKVIRNMAETLSYPQEGELRAYQKVGPFASATVTTVKE